MNYIDLRSDTITLPTLDMRKAIYEARVGDDVYREDPSVRELEKYAAKISGKESALFVPTGSMGNLLALYINGGRGNEVITASNSHIVNHEIASCSIVAGVLPISIKNDTGILTAKEIEPLIKERGSYDMAYTSLIEVENTIGGAIYPIKNLKEIRALADKYNLKVHMDGARVFNASTTTKISVKEYASYADTITFCLSKGLGAPMGSMLCGSKKFIAHALTLRKMLGSGTRQLGFMAAAGLFALKNNVERLKEDHNRAQDIVKVLNETSWANVVGKSETNIVLFTTKECPKVVLDKLKKVGILANIEGEYVRFVTNLNLSNKDMDTLLLKLKEFKL